MKPSSTLLAASLALSAQAAAAPIRQDVPALPAGATHIAATNPAADIDFAVVLPLGDLAGATRYALNVSTDFDPLRGKYLTPAQFRHKFGASPSAHDAVVRWLAANHLPVVSDSTSGTVIGVRASAVAIQAAFGVTLDRYRTSDGHEWRIASDTASAPAAIAQAISGIVGLSDDAAGPAGALSRVGGAGPRVARKDPATGRIVAAGNGPNGAFSAKDLRTAYGYPDHLSVPLLPVAVFETGGFDPADLATYATANHLPAPSVRVRGVSGYGGSVNDPAIELEAVANIDMIQAIAVGAPVIAYEQGTAGFRTALLLSLAAMADDDQAPTINISYGQSEHKQGSLAISAENQVFVQLAAQGQSVYVSSGDDGAFANQGVMGPRLGVDDPAAQPFVTAVGGTTLFTDQAGNRTQETGWSDYGDGNGASGGGISSLWPLPRWQRLYGTEKKHSVAEANGGSDTMRNVPDVAATASPFNGVAVYSALNGGWLTLGGTGISAPIWAASSTLASSGRAALGMFPVGFFNPTLYNLRNNPFFIVPNFDVINGYNGITGGLGFPKGYLAGYEFDDITGWGTPYYGAWLIDYFVFSTAKFTFPPAAAQNLHAIAKSTSISLHWSATAGAAAYVVEIFPWPASLPPPGTPSQPLQVDVTHDTQTVFSGLTPSTNYVVEVMPGNSGGAGFNTTVSGIELVTSP